MLFLSYAILLPRTPERTMMHLEKADEREKEIKRIERDMFIILWHEIDGEMDKYPAIKYSFDGYHVNI